MQHIPWCNPLNSRSLSHSDRNQTVAQQKPALLSDTRSPQPFVLHILLHLLTLSLVAQERTQQMTEQKPHFKRRQKQGNCGGFTFIKPGRADISRVCYVMERKSHRELKGTFVISPTTWYEWRMQSIINRRGDSGSIPLREPQVWVLLYLTGDGWKQAGIINISAVSLYPC